MLRLLQKRLFDSELVTIRQDKYGRVQNILQHIEKHGPSSTSQLARDLDMHYSRVRECVDWLTKLKKPILKRVEAIEDKPGKPEVPYQIIEPRWREIIRPKGVNRRVQELTAKLHAKLKEIETISQELGDLNNEKEFLRMLNIVFLQGSCADSKEDKLAFYNHKPVKDWLNMNWSKILFLAGKSLFASKSFWYAYRHHDFKSLLRELLIIQCIVDNSINPAQYSHADQIEDLKKLDSGN